MKFKNIIISLSLISLLASCSNGTTTAPVPTTPSDNSSNTGDSDYQPVGELQRLMKEIKKDSNFSIGYHVSNYDQGESDMNFFFTNYSFKQGNNTNSQLKVMDSSIDIHWMTKEMSMLEFLWSTITPG